MCGSVAGLTDGNVGAQAWQHSADTSEVHGALAPSHFLSMPAPVHDIARHLLPDGPDGLEDDLWMSLLQPQFGEDDLDIKLPDITPDRLPLQLPEAFQVFFPSVPLGALEARRARSHLGWLSPALRRHAMPRPLSAAAPTQRSRFVARRNAFRR